MLTETRSGRTGSKKTLSSLSSLFSRRKAHELPPEGLCEKQTTKRQSTTCSTYSAEAQAPRFHANRGPSLPTTPTLSWSSSTTGSQSSIHIKSPLPPLADFVPADHRSELPLFDFDDTHQVEDSKGFDEESDSEHTPAYMKRFPGIVETPFPDSFDESRLKMVNAFGSALLVKSTAESTLFCSTASLFRPVSTLVRSPSEACETSAENCKLTAVKPCRQRSNSGQFEVRSHNFEKLARDFYGDQKLPALPDWSVLLAHRHTPRQKPRVTRQQIAEQSKRTAITGSRRGSCPQQLASPLSPDVSETIPVSQPEMVDHMLGALCVLYWLADNRRFFDEECERLLRRTGAACLTIDHTVVGFETDFPHASLESYKLCRRSDGKPGYLALPYPDNSFDVITARALTSVIPDGEWSSTIAEFKRVLIPGGRLEIVTHDQWVNEGPVTKGFTSRLTSALSKNGYSAEQTRVLLPALRRANFTSVQVANLAIPISWGGRCAAVWHKYYEPLRVIREQNSNVEWSAEETPEYRYKAIKGETIARRSARTVYVVSATK